MSWAYEQYLSAAKWGAAEASELHILRERTSAERVKHKALQRDVKRQRKLYLEGWTFSRCTKCGFDIITLPEGKHYCPKCE